MSKLAKEFVEAIIKRNPQAELKDLNNLYDYYLKRPEILFDCDDLTNIQKCIIIKQTDNFKEMMNEVVLPDYFY